MQAHGRRFRRLAEERLVPAGFRVLAPDLRGHGRATWNPPWNLDTCVRDVLGLLDEGRDERVRLVGHSFGGRLALELLVHAPDRIAAAALLDPALEVAPDRARTLAEGERAERAFASREEAHAWRRESAPGADDETLEEELREHLLRGEDGRYRFRYAQSAVVALYGELAAPPPTVAPANAPGAVDTPPVLVVGGARSDVFDPAHVAPLRVWLGPSLEVVTVAAGHMVLWEAFGETADAILSCFERS